MTEKLTPGSTYIVYYEWTYIVYYECDEPDCDGHVVFNGGTTFASFPLIYPSTCNKCGRRYGLHEIYPTTRVVKDPDG